MDLQKINVKLLSVDSGSVPLTAFIDIFNSWIQASDGDYYDLADYSHMHAGPGVLLIADEANVSIDETGERRGLLYNQKRPLKGSTGEKLRHVFGSALEYCRKLEEEPTLGGKIRFRGDEALVVINDRLIAPNTEETFHALRPDLEELAQTLYAGADFSLERDADSKKRCGVWIRTPATFEIATLLRNLEGAGKATRRLAG